MKAKIILSISLTMGMINIGSADERKLFHSIEQDGLGKASQAVLNLKKHKNIKWSGVVVQTIKNEKETCFQIVETKDSSQGKPSYNMLSNDNSFIACTKESFDSEQYDNRLVTISGDIDSYFHSLKEQHDFPVIEITSVKTWPRKIHKINIPRANDSVMNSSFSLVSVN